jgi:hypothetical protein
MEMQQMMELLLKEIRASREDFLASWDADRRARREEMASEREAWREEIRSVRFETTNTGKETMAFQEMEACLEEEKMPTLVDMKPEAAEQREVPVQDATVMPVREPEEETTLVTRKEMMACQEMEARLEEIELTSVGRKPEVAQQQEVPNQDAVRKPVKGWKKQLRAKKQAAGQRREPKKLTQGDCGSRMQLAAACRKVYHRATVAWHKRIIFRKSLTQRNCRPQKEVTTAGIKFTCCAGHRRMGKKEDNAEQETPKRTE